MKTVFDNEDYVEARTQTIGGREYRFERRDPHGFIYIVCAHKLTEELRGAFITFDNAVRAVNIFENAVAAAKIAPTTKTKNVDTKQTAA